MQQALVFILFADFVWAAQALNLYLTESNLVDADKIHIMELHSTMETELTFDQDFVILTPVHTNGSHVAIPGLAHVVYLNWVQNIEFDEAVSKQVIACMAARWLLGSSSFLRLLGVRRQNVPPRAPEIPITKRQRLFAQMS